MNFEYPKDAAESVFANGFAALHYQSTAYASSSLRLCVRAGSIDEGVFSGCGISHLVEHMVFNGSGKLDKREVAEKLSVLGASSNAYTFYDRTVYCIDVPTENLESAMQILSDMMFRPRFDAESFALEKNVISREIDMYADDPDDVLLNASNAKTFDVHPMRFPIIGERKSFESLTLDDMLAYHNSKYCPQNMFLVCASDCDFDRFNKAAKKYFGGVKNGRLSISQRPFEPEQTSPRLVELYGDTSTARAMLTFKFFNLTELQLGAIDAISFTLAAGNSGKIVRKLKYDAQIIDSFDYELMRAEDVALLSFYWECSPAKAEQAAAAVEAELRAAVANGLSDADVEKYVNNSKLAIANAARNAANMAEFLVNKKFPSLDAPLGKSLLDAIETNAQSAGNNIFKVAFDFDKSTYAQYLPSRYKKKRAHFADANLSNSQIVKLSNGMPLILLQDRTSAKFHLRISSQNSSFMYVPKYADLRGIASIMALRDTKTRDAAALADFVETNALSFNSAFGDALNSVFAESLSADWRMTIGLLGDSIANLKISLKTFESEKSALISDILSDMDDPVNLAFAKLRKEFFGARNILAHSPDGSIEAVGNASEKDVLAFLKNIFSADNSVLCACGKFDKQEVIDACESEFSTIKPYCGRKSEYACKPAKRGRGVVIGGKNQSVVFAAMDCCGIGESKKYFARALLQEILGGEDGVVFERVREREGLAYGARVSSLADAECGMFCFSAATEEKNLPRVKEIFLKIIDEFSNGKIDEDMLSKAKYALKSKCAVSLEDISERAYAAVSGLLMRGVVDDLNNIENNIENVSCDDINSAAREILKNPFIFEYI